MTVRINKQKINLREKLAGVEDKVNFDEVIRGLGEYTGSVGIGTTNPSFPLHSVNASTSYVMSETTGSGTSAGFRMKGDASADFTLFTTQGTNQFAIYDNANTAQRLTLDSLGNVGIGTTSPNSKLEVAGGIRGSSPLFPNRRADFFVSNNASGNLYINCFDDTLSTYQPIFIDASELVLNSQSNGNVGIGTTNPGFPLTVHQDASGSLTSDFVHESDNQPYGIRIRFTNESPDNKVNYFLKCQTNGTPNERMVVWSNGDIETTLGNSIGTLSDIRTKDSVVDATPKLSDVMKLRVVNFTRKNDPDKTKLIGFVAQEVEEVFPRFVASGDNREYDEDGNVVSGFEDVKSVKFDSGFAILTKAIQEQQTIIEDLKSRIETLEQQ